MEDEKMTAGGGQWVRVRQMEAKANGASASQIHIARSLRRSRVRAVVAMYLYKIHPAASYRRMCLAKVKKTTRFHEINTRR